MVDACFIASLRRIHMVELFYLIACFRRVNYGGCAQYLCMSSNLWSRADVSLSFILSHINYENIAFAVVYSSLQMLISKFFTWQIIGIKYSKC